MHRGQPPDLELFLFTQDVGLATRAVSAGVDGIVIDWERRGKHVRQHGADTEVNEDTVDDLRRIRAAVHTPVLCRINAVARETSREIEAAVDAGADEVLVPMIRRPEEVELALELAAGRLGVGILVETVDAVDCVQALGRLPVSRVFVGLNDLAIERHSPSIFSAVLDGTVERIRSAFSAPFGVAGMTVPDAGDPIPSRLLTGELVRLRCSFTFLRRSFRRDIVGRSIEHEVPRMREALQQATLRSPIDVSAEREELADLVESLEQVVRPPEALRA
jgi:2-keto-3-deoxy-L-rhamnonate aldolase RhmA